MPVFIKRLFRRLRWFVFRQWRTVTQKQWPYETCWMCGKAIYTVWYVKDRYWRDVVGVFDTGGGSLCVGCFIEYAERLNIDVPQEAFEIAVFMPTEEDE